MFTWVDLIGWCGTVVYLANHAYLSLSVQHKKTLYFGANALAAACLVFSSVILSSWQAALNNGFWLLISVLLLAKVNLQQLTVSKVLLYVLFGGLFAVFLFGWASTGLPDAALMGWSSVLCFGMAYLLLSATKITVLEYLCWNIYAALAFLPQLWLDQNIPVLALEIAWAGVSVFGALKRKFFTPAA